MDKARDWSTRLVHEAAQHEQSSFITLTYSDEHLPPDYSINVRDLQLFMKRLRKARSGQKLRFFACGEYGEQGYRPHYHLIMFGYMPDDITPWRKTPSGYVTYRSVELEKVWPFGHVELGSFSRESAGYVARYCLKKVNGKGAEDHYTRVHPQTGEVIRVQPEFIVMSRRPGIGAAWWDKYSTDCFPSDFLVMDGTKVPVPDYYTRKLEDQERLKVKQARQAKAQLQLDNNTPERLAVREESLQLRVNKLKRELET